MSANSHVNKVIASFHELQSPGFSFCSNACSYHMHCRYRSFIYYIYYIIYIFYIFYKEMTHGKAPLFHALMGDLYGAATFCEVCSALNKV
jgi:hypothetical protein